ncbi:MAG: MATE family efflux transporter [Methanomassiliicoccaceae archaeon]|nr:MATE family efflux transporter [Methanomassiliicoccaceae archaeon]
MEVSATKGVNVLLGDPRKAIVAFSIPIAVALLAQQSNSLVDSFWVTGLGGNAMAALGLVSPIYSILVGIGSGLGIGASAAIARCIGMGRAEESGGIAAQSLIICIIAAIIATPVLLLTAEPVLIAIGAGPTIEASMEFAIPLYISAVLIFISGVMSGIMRGEGAVRRSMYIQVIGAIANLILDPIFIYSLDMGVAGAAWATTAAFGISIIIGLYWYFVKKDMFIKFRIKDMRPNIALQREILSVGLPQTAEFTVMSAFNVTFNFCIIMVGGTSAMAIYTVAWRLMYILLIPAQAMGGAIVSACSAEFGMKRYDMIRQAYLFSVKTSVLLLSVFAVTMCLLAGPIASVFTVAPDMQHLHGDMVVMLYIFASFIPIMSLIYIGSSLLQALKRSKTSLISTFIRNAMLAATFLIAAYCFGTLTSLWWAMFVTEVFGGALMGYWAYVVLKDVAKRDGRTLLPDT